MKNKIYTAIIATLLTSNVYAANPASVNDFIDKSSCTTLTAKPELTIVCGSKKLIKEAKKGNSSFVKSGDFVFIAYGKDMDATIKVGSDVDVLQFGDDEENTKEEFFGVFANAMSKTTK